MFVSELSGCGFSGCSHLNFRCAPDSSNEFLDIQENMKCGFTLKRVLDMIRSYSQLLAILQCTSITSMISKSGKFPSFSPYHPLLILSVIMFSILFAYVLIERLSVFSPCFLNICSK